MSWLVAAALAAEPDPAVASVPTRVERQAAEDPSVGLAALVAAVTEGASEPAEKAKRIHDWIATHVSYDFDAFTSGALPPSDVGATLARGTAVCEGYASLFQAMGELAGLEVNVVHGYGRGVGFEPFDEHITENHAWNVVRIDGTWRPVDVTWDAGTVRGGEWQRVYGDGFFLTDPSVFLHSHLPTDPAWQLVTPPLSTSEFQALPLLRVGFGAVLDAPTEVEEINESGPVASFSLGIRAPGSRVRAVLVDVDGNEIAHRCLVDGDGTTARVRVAFPSAGRWIVRLFAGPAPIVPKKKGARPIEAPMEEVAAIAFESSGGAEGVVPVQFGGWKADYELLSDVVWVPGTATTVTVRLPGVREALAWYGTERWPMQKRGEVFTVDIPARPGFYVGDDAGGILGFHTGE